MKKNIIMAIIAALTAMATYARNDSGTALVIESAAGDTAIFVLDEKPKLTFSGTSLFVTSATYEAEYVLSDLRRYSFRQMQSSGINAAESGMQNSVRQDGGKIIVSGIKPGTSVKVFSVSGMAVSSAYADAGGHANVDITSFPTGIYIVKYGDNAIKIRKL